jgi:hypothetical protein
VWDSAVPAQDDPLRQGDLLTGIPFPRRGTLTLTAEEMRAAVYPSRSAVVLDQCCTVEQQHTVLLGRVGEVRRLPAGHKLAQALEATHPEAGKPYAKYMHRLDELDPHLPWKANKVWVIELTERVSVAAKTGEDLAWMRSLRSARVTTVARALLRAKLLFHFSETATEDTEALVKLGYDNLGRPSPASA